MNVLLCAPDYSAVSKPAHTVKVVYRQPSKGEVTDLDIDSTGLQVFGESEWKLSISLMPNPARANVCHAVRGWHFHLL